MKKFILYILVAIPVFLTSCSGDDIRFTIPGVDDQMHLAASEESVTLEQDRVMRLLFPLHGAKLKTVGKELK